MTKNVVNFVLYCRSYNSFHISICWTPMTFDSKISNCIFWSLQQYNKQANSLIGFEVISILKWKSKEKIYGIHSRATNDIIENVVLIYALIQTKQRSSSKTYKQLLKQRNDTHL